MVPSVEDEVRLIFNILVHPSSVKGWVIVTVSFGHTEPLSRVVFAGMVELSGLWSLQKKGVGGRPN
jgi:hypothetical protein